MTSVEAPLIMVLGLKTIPRRFVPLFKDEELVRAFSDARNLASQTPSGWEVVEVPRGGGIQPLDLPYDSIPVELSEEAKASGQKQMEEAYKRIEIVLGRLERHIKEQTALRVLLILVGLVLILSGIAILVIGIFRHSEVELIGKGGAATILLGAGIPILTSMYAKDRKLRTLPSRIRLRFAVCRLHVEYSDIRKCFLDALEEYESAFLKIQHTIKNNPDTAKDIVLPKNSA
jgi:hypothetical protein